MIIELYKKIKFKPIQGLFIDKDSRECCLLGAMLIDKLGVQRAEEICFSLSNTSAFFLGRHLGKLASRAQGINDGWENQPFKTDNGGEEYVEGYKFGRNSWYEFHKISIKRLGYFRESRGELFSELCEVTYPLPQAPEDAHCKVLEWLEVEIPTGTYDLFKQSIKAMSGLTEISKLKRS